MAIAELPSWLAVEQRYEPAGARHRVMQKNVLHLASLLERVRLGGGANEGGSMVDRALSCVSAPVRLVGMFVCVLCVCLTQSPLYLMLMATTALVLVAVRPVRGLRATFVPALATAGFAVVLALPALLLGASATDAMLKIALKTFINVSFVLGVSWTLTWSRMSAALKMLRLPDEVIFTFDMALKHIEVLGRTAHDLCESVMLRSVGRTPEGFSRTESIAGIDGHDLYQGDGMQPRDGRGHAVSRLRRRVSGACTERLWLARCGLRGRCGVARRVVRGAVARTVEPLM